MLLTRLGGSAGRAHRGAIFTHRRTVTEQTLECFDHASKQGLGAKDCSMLPVSWSAKPQKL